MGLIKVMKKFLDNYYLVCKLSAETPNGDVVNPFKTACFFVLLVTCNILSLFFLFAHDLLAQYAEWLWGGILIVCVILTFVLDAVYNDERRNKLWAEHENDSADIRHRRVAGVVIYTVFTFAFLIFAIWYSVHIDAPQPEAWPYSFPQHPKPQ